VAVKGRRPDVEVVSVLAQRAASEGPRWMRAKETTSTSSQECGVKNVLGQCAQ